MRIKQIVKCAIAAHHTFMIYGRTRVIREAMLRRGWCEKFFRKNANGISPDRFTYFANRIPSYISPLYKFTFSGEHHFNVDASPVILLAGIGDLKDQQSERQLISRMLTNHTVDFLWNTGSEWPGWPAQENKTTIFNRYCRAGFTSKVSKAASVHFFQSYERRIERG